MDRRERLTRCYFHQELDRPGVYVRTGFPAGDPTYDRLKAYLGAHTELKIPWGAMGGTSLPVDTRVEAISEDFERHIHVLHTPAGDLTASSLVSRKGQPGRQETYFINSPQDAQKYLSLPEPQASCEVDSFFPAVREASDRGIVDVSLGANPAGHAAELCGSENFAILSLTDRDVLHALCARRMRAILVRLEYVLARGVGPFFSLSGQEYVTPPLHGPADFDDFNLRYDKPILDAVHEAGGRVHVHCHGSVRKVFGGFLATGVDVLHPFEAPPMGDITAAEAKARARGRMCLEGNIQIGDMYEATPEEIGRQTHALIETAFDDRRGLIVCPTASPYIRGRGEECFPRFQAMAEAVVGRRA